MTSPLTLNVPALLAHYGEQLLKRLAEQSGISARQRAAIESFQHQYAIELDRVGNRGVSASASDFNEWIRGMFAIVEQGGSRDELLRSYVAALKALQEERRSDALFCIVIEQIDDGSKVLGYRVTHQCGAIHRRHWANFQSELGILQRSTFLQTLLRSESSIPLQLASTVPDYDGFLDSFARAVISDADELVGQRRSEVREWFWLTAVSLISQSADQARRILFQVYRNIGTVMIPNPGKGSGLEVRALEMLRIAYGLVDHQETTLALELGEQRKNMIMDMAPTIYSHDLMTPVANINGFTALLVEDLNALGSGIQAKPPSTKIMDTVFKLAEHLDNLDRDVGQLYRYLDAYASLERGDGKPWKLSAAIPALEELTRANSKRLSVVIDFPKLKIDPTVAIERVFFMVMVMNLLNNALLLIERVPKEQRLGRVIVQAELTDAQNLRLWVANTDTHIDPEHKVKIFWRGFSTRGGSGRGLYLCQRICQHVGASLELATPQDIVERQFGLHVNVAFKLDLPIVLDIATLPKPRKLRPQLRKAVESASN